MISHLGRTVVRLHPSSSCVIKFHVDSTVQRVSTTQYTQLSQSSLFLPFSQTSCRGYATKPVSRPKAHTGRTTSTRTRKPKATKTTTTTATSAKKKPAGTKSTKAKKAAPKKKAKKVKKAANLKAKPKRTTRKKKPLTEEQAAAAAEKKKRKLIRTLKADALKPPKALPATAFQVLIAETAGQTGSGVELLKEKVAKYKQLVPEQLEVRTVIQTWWTEPTCLPILALQPHRKREQEKERGSLPQMGPIVFGRRHRKGPQST